MAQLRKDLFMLLVLLAIIAGVLLLFGTQTGQEPQVPLLAQSAGAAAVISYTNDGFQPETAQITQGTAVRFENNSSGNLWVAAYNKDGGAIYPGTPECGASPLDTCRTLSPGDSWTFTFDQPGTWGFHNNFKGDVAGTIEVQ